MRPHPGTLGVWGGARNHHLQGPDCPQRCHFSLGCPSSHTCSGFAVLHPFLDSFTTLSDPPMAVEQLGRGHQWGNPIFPMEPPLPPRTSAHPGAIRDGLFPSRERTAGSGPPLGAWVTAGRAAGDSQDLASTALGAARGRAPRGRWGPTRAWLGLAPWLRSPWGCAHVPRRGSAAHPPCWPRMLLFGFLAGWVSPRPP